MSTIQTLPEASQNNGIVATGEKLMYGRECIDRECLGVGVHGNVICTPRVKSDSSKGDNGGCRMQESKIRTEQCQPFIPNV
jgi:hypothetical protein